MSANIVGSNMPDSVATELRPSSKNYGQNGYGGASSDLPGQRTTSGFLNTMTPPVNDQLRKVKADALPASFGMKKPDPKSL